MKKVFAVAAALFLVAALGSAAPMCTTGPTLLTSSFSCSIGGLTFSNFQVMAAAGNSAPEVDLVSADTASGMVNLQFNPNMSAPPSGGSQDIYFWYQVSGGVTGVQSTVGGSNASILEKVCSAAFSGTSCNNGVTLASLAVFSAPPGPSSASANIASTNPLFVFKDINVSPNSPSAGGGILTEFTQSFSTGAGGAGGAGGGQGGQVPEPVSFVLMGSGLVALSLVRKIRKA